jgi:hypothetical protein
VFGDGFSHRVEQATALGREYCVAS